MKKLLFASIVLGMIASISPAFGQRISLTANISDFRIDNANSGNTNINYQGSSSMSANLRLYSKKHWALRLGAGLDNVNYTVANGIQTDYTARRQDIQGIIGFEKHFIIGNFLDIYPGTYVPVVVVGNDIINDNYAQITNGNLRAGLGMLVGANVKLLKILRVGVEFNASYDNFKNAIYDGVENQSFVPIKGLNYNTALTLGVAF